MTSDNSVYDLIEHESLDIAVAGVKEQIKSFRDLIKERQEKEFDNPGIDDSSEEEDRDRWGKRMRLLGELGVQADALNLRCEKIETLLAVMNNL